MTHANQMVKMYRKQAKKYKSMGLAVQRTYAVDFAMYYRRLVKAGV